MPSYPVNKIRTADKQVNILQITDLHLSLSSADDDDKGSICHQNFEAVLQQALNTDLRCDLIMVTGDLVTQVKTALYDYIFKVLQATNIPFVCIAGNHDVTEEDDSDLPFMERTLIAQPADTRLLTRHVIETDYWQLLLLDSSIMGKVAGQITPTDIDWLCERLSVCNKPTLIALHHHVIPVDSAWIDRHMAENAGDFWQRMAAFEHLKVIISGHIHQEQVRYCQGVAVYSTPSTCYQFKPLQNDFAYDPNARPGYRWLQLANNGKVASWVERLDT